MGEGKGTVRFRGRFGRLRSSQEQARLKAVRLTRKLSPVTAYLDHAATTPMLPSAIAAMADQLATTGNASSLHTSGRMARRVVEETADPERREPERQHERATGRDVEVGASDRRGEGALVLRDIDLSVRRGEILGIAGLVGSGRTQLAETIFGLTPADEGEITIDGRPVTIGVAGGSIGVQTAMNSIIVREKLRRMAVNQLGPLLSTVIRQGIDEGMITAASPDETATVLPSGDRKASSGATAAPGARA